MRVRTRLDALPRAIGQPGQQAVVVLITAQYSIVCIFIEPGHSFLEVIAAGQAQRGTAGAVPFRAPNRSRNAVAAFGPVSYTQLTLPTKRRLLYPVDAVSQKKKNKIRRR